MYVVPTRTRGHVGGFTRVGKNGTLSDLQGFVGSDRGLRLFPSQLPLLVGITLRATAVSGPGTLFELPNANNVVGFVCVRCCTGDAHIKVREMEG